MNQWLSIGYDDACLKPQAEHLSHLLNLPISKDVLPRLQVQHHRIVLLQKNCQPAYVDFERLKVNANMSGLKKQGLVQACKPAPGLKILDTTAGWGGDAAILAYMGAHVLMLERNPVMSLLLQDGLKRLGDDAFIKKNLAFQYIDAKTYLEQIKNTDLPDVIYIDPMHPVRQKSALVKKNMHVLQQLIGEDEDVLELLQLASTKARQRVVLKWPQKGPTLLKPGYSIKGKTIRFDVYPNF